MVRVQIADRMPLETLREAEIVEVGAAPPGKRAAAGWNGLRSVGRAVAWTAKRGSIMFNQNGVRSTQESIANQLHQELAGRSRKSIKISENSFLRRKKLRVKAAHMHLLKQVAHRRACRRTPAARGP